VTTSREWLIADGLGGFASGTADLVRTRRYHALLLVAAPCDERRFVLVNGLELWAETAAGQVALSSQRYVPDIVAPDGATRIRQFESEPWPTWTYDLGDGRQLVQQLFVPRASGRAAAVMQWRVVGDVSPADAHVRLHGRPLLSGRDFHALHRENAYFDFQPEQLAARRWQWHPYHGVPPIVIETNGAYHHDPLWYRQFLYTEERARGLDDTEDLASPGVFSWELGGETGMREAMMLLTVPEEWLGYTVVDELEPLVRAVRANERAIVAGFKSRLRHSADQYLVRRGDRHTVIAGYPWFTDWGRDTFIALRGLCFATNRLDDAERILLSWCDTLSDGMMPNHFPANGVASYNSVDAALWFVLVAHIFRVECVRRGRWLEPSTAERLTEASDDILTWYSRGTRYGIHMDDDGLLASGEPGAAVALTWMDAVVDGVPVTPRNGKAVEVQALWINALSIGASWSERWGAVADRARSAFNLRFWNDARGCLYDVIDVDHVRGVMDGRMRPNQIFAVGGLLLPVIEGARARRVVDSVEHALWTPMGLRTLAVDDSGYVDDCVGDASRRDRAYHNGPAWPWLMGAFVDAWIRVRAGAGERTQVLRTGARRKLLGGLARHLDEAGVGHVSEIADGNPPWTPRGCPFQAWSVGELLRVMEWEG
jgi:predicted glycogen debranching enzyme